MPPRYRLYPGWIGDYGKVSGRWLLAALDAGELAPGGRVLDIGCGPGRLAARLTHQLDGGSYEGFDIVPRSIGWCQRKISARHPSFRFQLADIRNAQYNPTGSQEARAYSFPYPDREFDLALAASVFTHMRPGEIERYVCEAARVLKPGGRLLASFFMLNEDAELRLADSRRRVLGEEQRDGGVPYRSGDPAIPEHMIASSSGTFASCTPGPTSQSRAFATGNGAGAGLRISASGRTWSWPGAAERAFAATFQAASTTGTLVGMASRRQIWVKDVPIGGGAPVVVQTMTKTETANVAATMEQIRRGRRGRLGPGPRRRAPRGRRRGAEDDRA